MRFDIEDLSLYDDAGEADFIDVFEFKNAEVIETSSPEQSVQGRIAALTRHGGSVICPCLPVSRSRSSLLRNSHRMGFPTIWIITVPSPRIGQCKTKTGDCGLQTRGKMLTRGKMQTVCKMQTAD